MNLDQIFLTLNALRIAADELTPALAAIGVNPRSVTLIGYALDVANDVKQAIETGETIANAEQQAQVDALIEDLQMRADLLGRQVDAT